MFLLDTNVLSELRVTRSRPAHPNVSQWARQAASSSLYLSTITILELEVGMLRMERHDLQQAAILRTWIEKQILVGFSNRIIPFDVEIARRCAALHVPNRRPDRDAIIAATALVHNMTVVTRNVADFAPTGVRTFNPWMAG